MNASKGKFRADVERFGLLPAIRGRFMHRLQKRFGVHVCRVKTRPLAHAPPDPNLPPGMRLCVLDKEVLLSACEDTALSLSGEFVEEALERGDVSFGALDGDRVVAYVWRTLTAAPHTDGLWVRVDRPYRYGYKGFVLPEYRGRRLDQALSFFSDAYFLERGYTQDIGFVDTHNLASVAAEKRKGNVLIGYAGYVNWFGRCLLFRTPAVKRTGFEFYTPS